MDLKDFYKFENLVIEGGGSRGFAYIGAILKLEEMGLLKNFKRFSGSSVGSLFAVLLCIGYSATELLDLSQNLDLTMPGKCGCSKLYSIWNNMGVYPLLKFEKIIRNILKRKVDPDITLSDLYKKTKKDLVIVVTNLNKKCGIYLHYINFPTVKLIDALLSSISVPAVFQPRKMRYTGTYDYYIDGGIVDNYPIWVFNDLDKLKHGKIDEIDKESEIPTTTLGLKLLSGGEKNNMTVFDGRIEIEDIQTYLSQVINTLMLQIERSDITPSYVKQTIPINIQDMSFIKFDLNPEQINALIECGKRDVFKYFNV